MTVRTALLAVATAMLGAACAPADRGADLRPPPDFVAPPIRPLRAGAWHGRLGFGSGFFPPEWGGDGRTWRWMGARGEVRLENDHSPHSLRVEGWVPLEFLAGPPTLRLMLGDHLLESFVAHDRTVKKEYRIDAAWLGSASPAVLVIETSATANAPNDSRDLGFAVEQVGWK